MSSDCKNVDKVAFNLNPFIKFRKFALGETNLEGVVAVRVLLDSLKV